MQTNDCNEVVETEFLVGEILQRSGCSRDFVRSSIVNKFWQSTGRISSVSSGFARRNKAEFLGFIVEYRQKHGTEMKLLVPPGYPANHPSQAMGSNFFPEIFYDKYVLGSHGGHLICRIEASGKRQGKIYMSCPYWRPRKFTPVGAQIPPIITVPDEHTENVFSQFIVLGQTDGPRAATTGFFVKDANKRFYQPYEGVKFKTGSPVRVHICVFNNGGWNRAASDPITTTLAIFHRNPYCIKVRSVVYMMYLVGLIACFDLEQEIFSVVHLPGQMGTTVRSWFEYTVGPHQEGDLIVVHLQAGALVRWVLTRSEDAVHWYRDKTINLIDAFGFMMNVSIMQALDAEREDCNSIQVRSVSPDGRFILISIGVIHGYFMVDMLEEKVKGLPNEMCYGNVGRVFPLTEDWPPKP